METQSRLAQHANEVTICLRYWMVKARIGPMPLAMGRTMKNNRPQPCYALFSKKKKSLSYIWTLD